MSESQAKFDKEQFEEAINLIDSGVKNYIKELKQQSSEEILNGTVEKAQEIIGRIIPVETMYKNLNKTQKELVELINNQFNGNGKSNGSEEKAEEVKKESAEKKEKETTEEEKADDKLSEHSAYRIPILKGLIYLGGSAEVNDVTDFIKRDMKNKFSDSDLELMRTEEKKWFGIVEEEKNLMQEEGLLNNKSENGTWEIVQKGIDYLSKHGK